MYTGYKTILVDDRVACCSTVTNVFVLVHPIKVSYLSL